MSFLDQSTILLTGASSGIGREMARQLGPRAGCLILVARREQRLQDLKAELQRQTPSLEVVVRPTDLADLDATKALAETCMAEDGPVDVLINNAGVGDHAWFHEMPVDKLELMLTLNVNSLALLSRLLLPGMLERGRGGILNVSSGFGRFTFPTFAAYAGSKHFVTAFTDALAAECAGTGVVISQVTPGPVQTEFAEHANVGEAVAPPSFVELAADDCARRALRGFERGRITTTPGLHVALGLWLADAAPRWALAWVHRLGSAYLRAQGQ